MEKFPGNSLDPASQPWAREVEHRIRMLDSTRNAESTRQANSAAGVIATLGKLSDQIAAIADAQQRLDDVVSDLSTQQSALTAQVAYTSSLISREESIDTFSSGAIPSDGVNHWVGPEFSVTIPVSTGKIRVTYGAAGISLNNGSSSTAVAGVSLAVDGLHSLTPGSRSAGMFLASNSWVSVPVARINHYEVPTNSVTTVRARCFVWGNATGADAQFSGPRLVVDVVNPN